MSLYAYVCVDVSHVRLDRLFCYALPPDMPAQVGMRAWVRFGKKAAPIICHIIELTDTPPTDFNPADLREILSIADDFTALKPDILEVALWMQDKYYTTLLKCLNAVLPSAKANGMFPTSRTRRRVVKQKPHCINLTPAQAEAAAEITSLCDTDREKPPYLLFGITGSGKTEVYLHAIEHVLRQGRTAIMLVPEIALTPQMVELFGTRFGDAVCLTHSRMTAGERYQAWLAAHSGECQVCIGPRSAVFAPLENLGLIIVDEEHEHTYHSEISPKYDARAVAIKRAQICGAAVVLGSATPSLLSYYRATRKSAAYKIGRLEDRINLTLPAIEIVDMREEAKQGNMSIFSQELRTALSETIECGHQAILFLNRRGFASFVSCRLCGEVYSCSRCRVNFTYHSAKNILLCHYCGQNVPKPTVCGVCNKEYVTHTGLGTQKVEESLSRLLPGVKYLRMDYDTTRTKDGHKKILDMFKKREASVLIGTQMVAKGLDFPGVTLVGVVLADMGLYTNDFRSCEHTFTLLTQVAGRAGRSANPGRVLIQTYSPHNYAIQLSAHGSYPEFYEREIRLRHAMEYPPFSSIFCVMLTGPVERDVVRHLGCLHEIMRYADEKHGRGRFSIIGISPAFVSKLKDLYRWKILLKSKQERPLVQFVLYCVDKLRKNFEMGKIQVQLSLNPMMME